MADSAAGADYWKMFMDAMSGSKNNDSSSADSGRGSEMGSASAGMKGGSQLLEGMWNEETDRQKYNRDIAFKNAEMQQAYQNNLPAMLKSRQTSREKASALASLAGYY